MKNKLVIFLSSILLGVSSLFVPLFNKDTKSAHAITDSDTTSYISVGELWDSTNQKVNKDNLQTLFDYVSGTLNSQYNNIEQLAEGKLTSKDMRANALLDYSGTAIKEEGKDIVVTLGGLKWQVVYLSDDKNGNPILTLWLANTNQVSVSTKEFAIYCERQSVVDPTLILYPSNMYGTSNVRSVSLNNGGVRATSETTLVEVEQNSASPYALFTMPVDGEYNDLTDFIATPEMVAWQEYQTMKQYNIKDLDNLTYNLSNESWSRDLTDDGFYASSHNYAHKDYSDNWKTDYIWLPSLTEVGGEVVENGVWELSLAQKENSEDYYLRTTDNKDFCVDATLLVRAAGNEVYDPWSNESHGIRPALHLNLSAMVDKLTQQEETTNAKIYLDPINGNDSSTGLTEFLAVKSLDVAVSKVENNGEIIVMNTIDITEDCVLGQSKAYTLKRYYKNATSNYQGTMLEIGTFETVASDSKHATVVIKNVTIDGNSIGKNDFYAHDGVIDVVNGNVCFENNSQYVNHNGVRRNGSTIDVGYGIELYNGSNITINGGLFNNNYNVHYGTLVNNKSNGKIVINGGTFTNNHTLYWGIFNGGTIEINGGIFGGWVDTNEDGIYQTSESLGNTAYNNGIIVSCANLTINDGTFHYNIVKDGGGSTAGSLFEANKIIVNSGNFLNNNDISTRENTHGGGVFNVGQSITINGGLFENNNSKRQGGVIYVKNLYNNPTVTIKNTTFKGNYSKIGGVIFSHKTGTVIDIENCIFEDNYSSGSKSLTLSDGEAKAYSGGGVIYAIGADITIKNSTFTNNTSNGNGGAIQVVDGGTLSVYNCEFINNDTTGEFGGAICGNANTKVYESYFDDNDASSCAGSIDNGQAINCTFKNSNSNNGGAVRSVACTGCEFYDNTASVSGGAGYSGSFTNCYFEGNSSTEFGGAVAYATVTGCQFVDNSTAGNGGAVANIDATWYEDTSTLLTTNCVFDGNHADGYGGAIYVNKGNLQIINSTITENSAGTNGGGVYFSSASGEGVISFGKANTQNKIVIENNTKTSGDNSNLYLVVNSSLPVIEIVSNLEDGSVVYVESSGSLFNQKVAQITGSEKYLTQQTIDAFEYKDGYDFYAQTLTDGTSKTGVGIYVKQVSTTSTDVSYLASDNYCDYDGLAHTINVEVLSPATNYEILYSDSQDGTYLTTPITVREPGESKVVWFKISANGTTTTAESREVKVARMNISIAENFIINAKLGETFTQNQAITSSISGKVVDALGNAVAVDLVYLDPTITVGYTANNMTFMFNVVPKNTEKYNSLKSIIARVNISYDNLYFKNNTFYLNESLDAEGSFATSVANLEQVVSLLNNNATIYFLSNYAISSTMSLETDNNIYLSRLISSTDSLNSSILTISSGATLNIGSLDMKGRITITGGDADYSKNATAPLISVNGTSAVLNIVGNVVIENAKLNKNSASGVFGAGISNNGTLTLDGTIIRNFYTTGNGGAIYNAGILVANNIKVESCRAVQYGSGIYSVGNTTLNNSTIASNSGIYNSSISQKGIGLAVVGEVVVKIDNCVFNSNRAKNNGNGDYAGEGTESRRALGGAMYFDGAVDATITNSIIQSNLAHYGSGMYVGANAKVVLTNTNFLHNSTYYYGSAIYIKEGGYVYFVSGEMAFNQFNNGTGEGTVYTYGTFDFGELGSDNAKINGDTSDYHWVNGAAVLVNGTGVFNMYGGVIQGFLSQYTRNTIYINTNAKAYIYSGSLLNNNYANYTRVTPNIINASYQIKGELYLNTRVVVNNYFSVILDADKNANIHLFGEANDLLDFKLRYCSVANSAGQYINGKIFDYDAELSGKGLTQEEWEYIISKITWNNAELIGSSTVEYVYDPIGNQYYAYLKAQEATNSIYFNPVSGSDSKDGTTAANALLTWDAVLKKASKGSQVYLCDVWTITEDTTINGSGITLLRTSVLTEYMFNITTANTTLTINNLIIDGRKHYNGAVYADEYLIAKAAIYSEVSCTINLNDTTIQNNATATSGSAIHLKVNGNATKFNLNLDNTQIINNTIYTTAKGKYMGVGIYVENTTATHTSPEVNIDIKNSNISNNTIINEYKSGNLSNTNQITNTTHYSINNINGGVGVAFNLAFDASSAKTINFNAFNTNIEQNQVEGVTYYSGVALLVYATGTGNNTNVANITTEKCNIINNGTNNALSSGVLEENVGAINLHTGNSVKVNANFIDTNFFDNEGYNTTLHMTSSKDGNIINFDGCVIDNEAFKLKNNYYSDINIKFAGANNIVNIKNSKLLNAKRVFFVTNSTANTKATINLENVDFEYNYRTSYFTNINVNAKNVKLYESDNGISLVNSNIVANNFVIDSGNYGFTLYGNCDISGVNIINSSIAFSKENTSIVTNLNIKDCYISNCSTGFNLQLGSANLTTSNTGKTVVNIDNCIFENCITRAILISSGLYTTTSTTYAVDINVKNTIIRNCTSGITTAISNYSTYPAINLNLTNTTVKGCTNGFNNTCESSANAITLTGGYFIDNQYALKATNRLDFKNVVALNSSVTDVYAPLTYFSGKNSIGTMYCESTTTTTSIFLTGSISGSTTTKVKLNVDTAVGLMVVGVDSSYTPTQTDFDAFLTLFSVDGATLSTSGLSIIVSALGASDSEIGSVAQTNVYYFDPDNATGLATADADGTTINAPFVNISQVLAKANSNVTVYIMSKYTFSAGTYDFKGMTLKIYFNNAGTSPYFTSGYVLTTPSGTTTIKNLIIDGNISDSKVVVDITGNKAVGRGIAAGLLYSISGTLTLEAVTVQNLYISGVNGITSSTLTMNNCNFDNYYSNSSGISVSGVLNATECSFVNCYRTFGFGGTTKKLVKDCYFEKCGKNITCSTGATNIEINGCEFVECIYSVRSANPTNSSSVLIKNCTFNACDYAYYGAGMSINRNNNDNLKNSNLMFNLNKRNYVNIEGCEIYNSKVSAIWAVSTDNIHFNFLINVIDTAIIGCESDNLVYAENGRFNFENSILSGAKYGLYIVDGYADFSNFTEVRDCEYGLYITKNAQVTADGIAIENNQTGVYTNAHFTLKNGIVANNSICAINSDNVNASITISGGMIDSTNGVISNDYGGSENLEYSIYTPGKIYISGDPIITAPVIANGFANSNIIDAGQNFQIVNNSAYPFKLDADGNLVAGNRGNTNYGTSIIEFIALRDTTISFDWISNSESNYDYFEIVYNEEQKMLRSGTGMTTTQSFSQAMEAGDVLKLAYYKDSSNNGPGADVEGPIITNLSCIDDFKKTLQSTSSTISSTRESTSNYYATTYNSNTFVERSDGAIVNNSGLIFGTSADYSIVATKAFTVNFDYYVETEANCDWFRVYYNGTEEVKTCSTSGSFENYTKAMNVGDILQLHFTNDNSRAVNGNQIVIKGLTYVEPVGGTGSVGTIAAPTILLGELSSSSIVRFVVPDNVGGGDAIASAFGASFDSARANALSDAVYVDGWTDSAYISGSKVGVQLGSTTTTETDWNQDFSSTLYFDPVNGDDTNSGRSFNDALKTWDAVESKNVDGKYNVVIMSNWKITEDTTIDLHGKTLSRYYINSSLKYVSGACITVNAGVTLTINNANINGNYIVNGVVACSTGSPFISVSGTGKLIYNNGTAYNNCNTSSGGVIKSTGGEVVVNSVKFIENRALSGGAIYVQNANLTIADCYFEANLLVLSGNGGAIYYTNTVTTGDPIVLTINGSTFINNQAKYNTNANYNYGGALYAQNNVSVNIANCLFNANRANCNGGAIYFNAVKQVNILNTTFEANRIDQSNYFGSAIYSNKSVVGTSINIDGCVFKNHNTGYYLYGVVYLNSAGDVTLKNSEFCYNYTYYRLISILNGVNKTSGSGKVTVENVYLHDNVIFSRQNLNINTAYGTFVLIQTHRSDDVTTIKDCVFEHNTITTQNGGSAGYNNFFWFDVKGTLNFENNLFKDNAGLGYLTAVKLGSDAEYNNINNVYVGNQFGGSSAMLYISLSNDNTLNFDNLVVEDNIALRMVCVYDSDSGTVVDQGHTVNYSGGSISNNVKSGGNVQGFALALEDISTVNLQGTVAKDNYSISSTNAQCEISLYNCNGTVKDVVLTGNTLQGAALRFGSDSYLSNSITLENAYIANNRNTKGGQANQEYSGAGIYARYYDNLVINNSVIENNTTTGYLGTGILGANSKITLNNTIVRNNNSKTTSLDIDGNLIKTNVGFSDVEFTYTGIGAVRGGGGISVYGGNLTVNGGEISGNTSSGLAGGIMAYAPVLLNGTKVYNNASVIGGGMILTSDSTIINSEIYDNYASSHAGAIWLGAKLTITGSQIYNNSTQGDGAGIYTDKEQSSLVIDGVLFKNNTAVGSGAGVYFENQLGTITLNNSEFVNNTSEQYGTALYSEVEVNVKNTKFVANNINGYSLIHYGLVRSATLENVDISGNFGKGENATLFSFGDATNDGIPRFNIVNSAIYGNLTQKKALIEITNNLYLSILESTVHGNVNSGEDGKGGLISVLDGTFKLENGQLSNNFAANGASVYFAENTSGLFINSVITGHSNGLNNYCQNGAVYIDTGAEVKFIGGEVKDNYASNLNGVIYNNGLLEMTDTAIYNNLINVGSVYNASAGIASFENVEIYENTANKGAGIANFGILNFVNGTISNNTAVDTVNADTSITYGEGGGVYNGDTGIFTLTDGEISYNSAGHGGGVYNNGQFILNNGLIGSNAMTHSGGGIYNYISGQLIINDGEISNNSPKEGATSTSGFGIANAGSMVMNGGEISNNFTLTTSSSFASSKGGAIYGFTTSSHTRIIGGKIVDNAAELGAGIYLDGGAVLDVSNITIDNETRLINAKIYGRAIYSNSSTVNLIDTTIKSSASVTSNNCYGSIYAQDSSVNIRGCDFIANRENYGVITCLGGSLNIVDTLFEGNQTQYDTNTVSGIINMEGVNSFNIEDSDFVNNKTNGSGVLRIKITNKFTGTIDNCLFSGNTATKDGGAIAIFSEVAGANNSELTISNTTFANNSAGSNGGALYVNGGNGATINLLNIVFGGWIDTDEDGVVDSGESYGNTASNSGGAIYIAPNTTSPVSVVVKGEIEVSYNTANTAGGIYYAYSNPTNTAENYYNLHLESGLYAVITKNSDSRGESNLYIVASADLKILSTGLTKDSIIGVTLAKTGGATPSVGDVIIKSYNDNLPLNSTDFKVFEYDTGAFGLKLDSAQNQIVLVSSTYEGDMIVIASDIVYGLDGKYKTVTEDDISVVGSSNYTITYSKEENGVYSENAPRYMSKGEYTIWYKVVDNDGSNAEVKGSLTLKITGKILVIKEAPTVYLNKDETLSQATFKGGMAISNGSSVSGTWAFADGSVQPSDTTQKYKLVFTPFNDDIYENEASIYVNINISYYKVYYYSDASTSGFFTDREHLVPTGIKSLSEMVNCMQENGVIFFMSTYTVGSTGVTEENVLSNKKVFMARYALHKDTPIISLPTNASTLKLSLGGGSGEIIIEGRHGYAAYNENAPLFENYGILILNSNVSVSGFTNIAGEASVVKNYGQLYLNGCQIYNNISTSTTVNCKGGAIANYGENAVVYFNGGDYRLNRTQGSTTYYGFGGFMYNEGGTVIINGGFFVRNGIYANAHPTNGGFLYTDGGSVVINGGDIMFNYAWSGYGGAIYATNGAEIKLNGGNILINFASKGGPGIYIAEDTSEVIINGGEIKFNVLSTANIISENIVADNQQNVDISSVIINIAYMLIALTFVVFSVYFYLPKNKKYKIKK